MALGLPVIHVDPSLSIDVLVNQVATTLNLPQAGEIEGGAG
jgi:hypothetical protein